MPELTVEMDANIKPSENAEVEAAQKMDCPTKITVTTEGITIEIGETATAEVDSPAEAAAKGEGGATAQGDAAAEKDAKAEVDVTNEVDGTDEVDATADLDAIMDDANDDAFINGEEDFIGMDPTESLAAAVALVDAVDNFGIDVNNVNGAIEMMSVNEPGANIPLCTCNTTDDLFDFPDVIEIDPNKNDNIDPDDADDEVAYDNSQSGYIEDANANGYEDYTADVDAADDGSKLEDEYEDEEPSEEGRTNGRHSAQQPEQEDIIKISESGAGLPISDEDMMNIVTELHKKFKKAQKEMCDNCVKQSITKIQTTIMVGSVAREYKMQMYLFDMANLAREGMLAVPSQYLN